MERNIRRVWLYTRQHADLNQLSLQEAVLRQAAEGRRYVVAGVSSDKSDDYLFYRPGLRKALSAIRRGEADALMVTRLCNISCSHCRLLRVLKRLQNEGAVLLAYDAQLRYDLYAMGLEAPLLDRAARKGLRAPWL